MGERNIRHKTPKSPLALFSVSTHSLLFFWGCVAWHLWIGRARHPGPTIGVEVFNVSRWLTNGDFATEAGDDHPAVTEHRLVPARARSEWKRLRDSGISSVWSPGSQEFSHVGNAGVGVVSIRGALWLCLQVLLWSLGSSLVWVGRSGVCFP